MSYFEERSTGDLMAVLNDDVNQLERFLDRGANDLLQVGTTVVLISIAFFWIAPGVAALAMLPIPVIVLGSFLFQSRIARRYAAVREQAGLLNGQLSNNLQGVVTIKSFTSEDVEVERISAASNEYRDRNRLAIRLSSAFSPLIRMAIVIGFTATLVYGGLLAVDGCAQRRLIRCHGVPDPATALAAHPARRDVRSLPPGHGIHHPGPRRPRHPSDHRLW